MGVCARGQSEWQAEVESVLDSLVARNFEQLYVSMGTSEYIPAWGAVSRALREHYGVLDDAKDDSVIEKQRMRRRFISFMIEKYSRKVFPYELYDARIRRFVQQYGELPSQAPEKWDVFELSQRTAEINRRNASDARLVRTLTKLIPSNPDYANR